ncbi:N-(5'-phosphoribosyl)anthranilate isomerase [Amylibacter marinus]|uniref:N-(5'-phosphoribosyl)anthranilate isomerase n=1 Tax=Amylibacter marinus TaxID=1475483 RepID=A0ABQ5VR60_9RHOB|nr:phosphoribosylanthranilate isomerase [Amylibacter marinus]GLQ33757.1 N-(5'-phosphoribosyl)anthranilate isomerase [Amylibacter marinus]
MRVKICGLSEPATLNVALASGVSYVGFVFFPKSPRNVSLAQGAALAQLVPAGRCKVGLVVNPSDVELEQILDAVPLDMIQLHGSETPERVSEIKDRFSLPVMKAVGLADEGDLPALQEYGRVCDQLLVDAKPPKNADLPGGNGLAFDWRLIAGRRWAVPWMLAGGLTPENVADAIRLTGATQVDVSSGVEAAVGVKDAELISDFIDAAQGEPLNGK